MSDTIFRIYCGLNSANRAQSEEDREAAISLLCDKYFGHGCTSYDAVGHWKGMQERTIIVEVVTNSPHYLTTKANVSRFAGAYKVQAFQESVMVTEQKLDVAFI